MTQPDQQQILTFSMSSRRYFLRQPWFTRIVENNNGAIAAETEEPDDMINVAATFPTMLDAVRAQRHLKEQRINSDIQGPQGG